MTTDLIPIIRAERLAGHALLCNARDLHVFLGITARFNDWMRRRIEEYGFVEDEDFYSILSKSTGGRPGQEYHLTLDMAKELAMIENNYMGRRVRRYFIERERQARELLEEQAKRILPLPGVKRSLRDGLKLKDTLVLQAQSSKLTRQLTQESNPAVRFNLHCHLRQVNDCLGIPTLALDEITPALPPARSDCET